MAIYENLPVYKAVYDLILMMFRLNRNLSRDYRYTLGENIKNGLVTLIVCIYNANGLTEKKSLISQAREQIVIVKLQIRLLRDLNQINIKQYASACELIESISKQLSAWQKSVEKRV